MNSYGQLGNGTMASSGSPVTVTGDVSNAALIASQETVLVNKTASTGTVAGHITPVPWSMTKTGTGRQALIVTYDPLAAAAAMFIEQYDAHVAACDATTNEADIMEDDLGANTNGQKQGKRLWACSNENAKMSYRAGMKTLLDGARHYLFGSDAGCIQSTETVDGVACPVTTIGPDPVHYPYTLFVPAYTSAAYNAEYYGQVESALASYRSALVTSSGPRLARSSSRLSRRSPRRITRSSRRASRAPAAMARTAS